MVYTTTIGNYYTIVKLKFICILIFIVAEHLPVMMDIKNSRRCRKERRKQKTMFKCVKFNLYFCITVKTYFLEILFIIIKI